MHINIHFDTPSAFASTSARNFSDTYMQDQKLTPYPYLSQPIFAVRDFGKYPYNDINTYNVHTEIIGTDIKVMSNAGLNIR